MITPQDRDRLRVIVADMHLERVLSDLNYLVGRLEEFSEAYRLKAATVPRDFPQTVSVTDVLDDYGANAFRVKALLQATAYKCSPEMLAMMWMVELGADIAEVRMSYRIRDEFSLSVTVCIGYSSNAISFSSSEIWDAAILRFVGIAKAGDAPLFEGFYPMRIA